MQAQKKQKMCNTLTTTKSVCIIQHVQKYDVNRRLDVDLYL
jgi:hypothetical protein